MPTTPGNLPKSLDPAAQINFPLVSHSPTIPSRTPADINFPKVNASPTHFVKLPGTTFLLDPQQQQQLGQQMQPMMIDPITQQPVPVIQQPGLYGQMSQQSTLPQQQFIQQSTVVPQPQQQPQQQSQPLTQSIGASISSLFAPLKMFGSRQQRQSQQQQQTATQPSQPSQPQPAAPLSSQPSQPQPQPQPALLPMDPNMIIQQQQQPLQQQPLTPIPVPMMKRGLPQPPPMSTIISQQASLQPWPEEDSNMQTIPSQAQQQRQQQQSFSEENLLGSGTSTRMLPSASAKPSATASDLSSIRRLAEQRRRDRMKYRSSTWTTDEQYSGGNYQQQILTDDNFGMTVPPVGIRRRQQPKVPQTQQPHIKRPSSAGVLPSSTGTGGSIFGSSAAKSKRKFMPSMSVSSYQQASSRRITPPIPRAQRPVPLHQLSFHSDGAVTGGPTATRSHRALHRHQLTSSLRDSYAIDDDDLNNDNRYVVRSGVTPGDADDDDDDDEDWC